MGLHLHRKLTAAILAACMLMPLQAPAVFADDEISEPATQPPAEEQQADESVQNDQLQDKEEPKQETKEQTQASSPAETPSAKTSSEKEEVSSYIEIQFALYGEARTEWIRQTEVSVPAGATAAEAVEYLMKQCGGECSISDESELLSISLETGSETVSLSEGDRGDQSEWLCKINDKEIDKPLSECTLSQGDKLEVMFSEEESPEANTPAEETENVQGPAAGQTAVITLDGKVSAMEVSDKKLNDSYGNTKDRITSIGDSAGWSSDSIWMVLGLARAGQLTSDQSKAYYNSILSDLERSGSAMLSETQSSNNSRAILALTAAGFDPQNVEGRNLLEPLANIAYIKAQGMNGPIWALLAFDCKGYEIPKLSTGNQQTDERFQTTRDNLIQSILSSRKSDGGWAYSGSASDVDMTAMAVQALAPYYESDPKVHAAIDGALQWLSKAQKEDGSFTSSGVKTSESASQMIVALTSLGIDPAKDKRFLKNGKGAIDALMSFYTKGGGFKHVSDNYKFNPLATMQGYYALVAYYRNLNGKTSLYDMKDAGDGFVIDIEYEKEQADTSTDKESDSQKKNSTKPASQGTAAASAAPAALGATKGLTKAAGLIKIKGMTENAKGSIGLIEAVVKRGLGEDASSYSEDDIRAISEAYKAYLDLQPAEKLAVEKDKNWKPFNKLTEALGGIYHIDREKGVDVLDNSHILMPWYVRLVVKDKEITKGQEEKINGVLGEDGKLFSTYDIQFVNTLETDENSEPVQWHPDKVIKVNMGVPASLEQTPLIVHISDEGKIELLKSKVIPDQEERYDSYDKYAQFRSDDFSVYGIAGTSGSIRKMISKTEEEESAPDYLIWIYTGAAALAALALVMILRRRAKVSAGEK